MSKKLEIVHNKKYPALVGILVDILFATYEFNKETKELLIDLKAEMDYIEKKCYIIKKDN